jgi:hypothetical protein
MGWNIKTAKFEKKKDQRKSAPVASAVRPTEDEIKRELEAIRTAAQKAFDTHRRFWFHTPLEGAYALYDKWKAVRHSKKNAKQAARLFDIKMKKGAHPLEVIIKIVTPRGADTRRWVDGLLFAYNEGVAPKDLVPFLKANGGISGCERQFDAQK